MTCKGMQEAARRGLWRGARGGVNISGNAVAGGRRAADRSIASRTGMGEDAEECTP